MKVQKYAGLRGVVGVATVIAMATLASTARGAPRDFEAQQRADARVLFEQGVRQAEAGEGKAALASFRAAHEKSPNFRVLYNIGQLCARLGDTACAVGAYERYLRESGTEIPSARREAVEQELEALSRTLGTIRVRTSSKGAVLLVDDVTIGKTPLAKPIPVSAGAHVLRLVQGDKVVEERVKVVSGQPTTVTLEVSTSAIALPVVPPAEPPPAEPPATRPEPPPHVPPPAPESRRIPILPWVATGALAAATAVTGVLAASSYASFQRTRDTYPVSADELAAAQGSARDLFLVTSGLGVATVISAGLAMYFTFSSAPSPATGAVQGARVAAGPRGVAFEGTW